jgi:hypothetical protein
MEDENRDDQAGPGDRRPYERAAFECHVKIVMSHDTLVKRIRAEFLEMPGLRLTLEQAQRLCGVEEELCQQVLDTLVDTKFLCVKPNGSYARLSDGADTPASHPQR